MNVDEIGVRRLVLVPRLDEELFDDGVGTGGSVTRRGQDLDRRRVRDRENVGVIGGKEIALILSAVTLSPPSNRHGRNAENGRSRLLGAHSLLSAEAVVPACRSGNARTCGARTDERQHTPADRTLPYDVNK
ncbi:hypothetical protein IOD13_18945 [Brevibacterium casei]|nr:hypothetical protein [Brevibacterium casei]